MTKIVLAFYNFVHLQNPHKEKEKLVSFFEEISSVGTIILGKEGINGMCSLDKDKVEQVKQFLKYNFKLKDTDFKENISKSNVFKKLSVKVKKEIVTLGVSNIDPAVSVGCLLYTSPSPRDATLSRMPSSA